MLALALPWLKSTNLWLAAGILAMVILVFTAGERHESRKAASELAKVNVPLAKLSGTDAAEVPANDEAGKTTADAVAGAVSQTCPLTPESARLLASVR
jgi:hypothetical protein